MTVVFPGLANQSFEGKVSVITPAIDPVKRTSLVRIEIPNLDGQLRPGMSANVTTDIDAGEGLTNSLSRFSGLDLRGWFLSSGVLVNWSPA